MLAAALLRAAHVAEARAHDPYFALPTVDPRVYHEWAQRIAAGDWLGQDAYFNSPLYPYLLGAAYLVVGDSFLVGRVVNAALGTLTVALAWRAGRRLFGPAEGLLAAALLVAQPMMIFTEGELLAEPLQAALNTGLLLALLAARDAASPFPSAGAGLALGAAVLARPTALLFAPFAALWLLAPDPRRLWPRAAALAAGAALAIAPVTARNVWIAREPLLVSSQGGYNLWLGNNPEATGRYHLPSSIPKSQADDPLEQASLSRRIAEEAVGRPLSAAESSRWWARRALAFVVESPGAWLAIEGRKLAALVSAREVGDQRVFAIDRELSWVTRLPLPAFGGLLALAAVGTLASLSRLRDTWVLHALVASQAAALLLVFVTARYRLPFVPALAVLAAAGLAWLLRAASRGDLARLAGGLLLAALVTAASRREPSDRPTAQHHFNLANRLRAEGRTDEALAAYERAIALDPAYLSARNNHAATLTGDPSRRAEAEAAWRQVRELAIVQRDEVRRLRAEKWIARLEAAKE